MLITAKLEEEMRIVKRHIHVLRMVMENQPIGIIKLAQIMDIPEHKVRYSLRILEQEKLIEPSPDGAKLTKRAKKEIKSVRESLERIKECTEEMLKEIEEIERKSASTGKKR